MKRIIIAAMGANGVSGQGRECPGTSQSASGRPSWYSQGSKTCANSR
jgi:hypothetical protein